MNHPFLCQQHRSLPKVQHGGTFLGIVFGLVFGLGIALAVAVYVTKVPVPFINKGQSRTGEQDAAEAKKNKDWDPNAMIQGKSPVRAASAPASDKALTAVTKEPAQNEAKTTTGSTADGKPETRPDAKSDAKTEPRQDAKASPASGDPLGDLARVKASSGQVDLFTYMVQVGAFRVSEDAEAQRAKLTLLGIDVKVTEREQSGRTVFRVRAGPFERKEDAEKTKERLEASGLEAVLVRIQR